MDKSLSIALALILEEIQRIAGSMKNVFIIRVEPWTLTAFFYPGGKRILPSTLSRVC